MKKGIIINYMVENCSNCNLCKNQKPVIDNVIKADIMFVGISAKMKTFEDEIPLDKRTASGKTLFKVEKDLDNVNFYKTNIVKCPPIRNGKLYYPSRIDVKNCLHNFDEELRVVKPKIIFTLGLQNSNFILEKYDLKIKRFDDNFNYISFPINGAVIIPIHHPSYMNIYKRKDMDRYINSIKSIIEKYV